MNRLNRALSRIKRLPQKVAWTIAAYDDTECLILYWARAGITGKNWGDKLNPFLARLISGKNVIHASDVFPKKERNIYYMIGSSLEHAQKRGGIAWGVGFISRKQGLSNKPIKVYAVRGYHSMKRLESLGIDCPNTVGDPALLLPMFYRPKPLTKRYKVGVIPHCRELDMPSVDPSLLPDDYLFIDITGGLLDVVDQINSCDFIASSSLHGLICADSYGIPSQWIQLSDRPSGDGFKYHDYYSSTGNKVDGPIKIQGLKQLLNIRDTFQTKKWDIDLDRLLEACPFLPGK